MLPKKQDLHSSFKSRFSTANIKIAIKEKKADKRKEKSRVAAQIRRNKESQTLILLQNALPIGLPSPNQMLEKSIVIRIAGKTLFLLKNLDQVLGMIDSLTVPLISSNFLAFFTDNLGQIVYASPNLQNVLEQHHWSNLIGISIFDIMDFKSRWPVTGDTIKLKLLANPNVNCEYKPGKTNVAEMSFSSPLSYPSYTQSTIVSKVNIRSSPILVNPYISPSSIYSVWCSTSISHTNSKLRLLLLRRIQMQFGPSQSSINSESSKQLIFSTNDVPSFDRSLSWPSTFNKSKSDPGDFEDSRTQEKCNQKELLISVHDRKYNFEAVSSEFSKVVGESESELMEQNLLDIIHIEDVSRVKSYLDLIVERRESVSTPIYRIMCHDGRYCIVKTFSKQCSSNCSQSISLHHKILRTGMNSEYNTKYGMYEMNRKRFSSSQTVSSTNSANKRQKSVPFIMCQNSSNHFFQKRKIGNYNGLNERPRELSENNSRFHKLVKSESRTETENSFGRITKPYLLSIKKEPNAENAILDKDPFIPICLEKRLMYNKFKETKKIGRSNSICINQIRLSKPILKDRFENESNCSASHSMESCVLTSPSPESAGLSLDEQFLWDLTDSFGELSQTNHLFDDQYQNDLELILPI